MQDNRISFVTFHHLSVIIARAVRMCASDCIVVLQYRYCLKNLVLELQVSVLMCLAACHIDDLCGRLNEVSKLVNVILDLWVGRKVTCPVGPSH